MKLINKVLTAATLGLVLMAGSCETDAAVASRNISREADMFKINRRITFINGITDKYLLTVEGYCSLDPDSAGKKLDVTCRDSSEKSGFKKHFLGLSDNVTYVSEQLDSADVSVYHSIVIFKPQAIIPDIDLRGSMEELTSDKSEANQ